MKTISRQLALAFFLVVASTAAAIDITSVVLYSESGVSKIEYTYSLENRITLIQTYTQQGTEWLPCARQQRSYIDGELAEVLQEELINGEWQQAWSLRLDYQNGFLANEVFTDSKTQTVHSIDYKYSILTRSERSHRITGAQNLSYKEIFSYSLLGELLSIEYQLPGTSWRVMMQNPSRQERVELLQKRENQDWINDMRFTTYYDITRRTILRQTVERWGEYEGVKQWLKQQKLSNEYASGLLSEAIYAHWNNTFWQNNHKYAYTYDEQAHVNTVDLSIPLLRKWRSVATLRIDEQSDYLAENQVSFWGEDRPEYHDVLVPYWFTEQHSLPMWQAGRVEVKREHSGVGLESLQGSDMHVSPNPTNGLCYPVWPADMLSWQLLSSASKVCMADTRPAAVLDMSRLPSGVYLLVARTSKQIITTKIIKQ